MLFQVPLSFLVTSVAPAHYGKILAGVGEEDQQACHKKEAQLHVTVASWDVNEMQFSHFQPRNFYNCKHWLQYAAQEAWLRALFGQLYRIERIPTYIECLVFT